MKNIKTIITAGYLCSSWFNTKISKTGRYVEDGISELCHKESYDFLSYHSYHIATRANYEVSYHKAQALGGARYMAKRFSIELLSTSNNVSKANAPFFTNCQFLISNISFGKLSTFNGLVENRPVHRAAVTRAIKVKN